MSTEFPELMTAMEVRQALRCSLSHAYRLMRSGKVRAFEDGGRLLVVKASLEQYVQSCLSGQFKKGRGRPRKPRPGEPGYKPPAPKDKPQVPLTPSALDAGDVRDGLAAKGGER